MKWPLTEAAHRALDSAARLARQAGEQAVEPLHLLWALVLDESHAAEQMAQHGVTRKEIQGDLPEAARGDEPPPAEGERLEYSATLDRVLREAGVCVRRTAFAAELGSQQLLWGLASVPSPAATLLKAHGIEPATLPVDGDGTEGVGEPLEVDFQLNPQPDGQAVGVQPSGCPLCGQEPSNAQRDKLKLELQRDVSRLNESPARILDAAANRAREGLRVVEDFVRFELNDAFLTRELKECRHELAAALTEAGLREWLPARDTPGDVGTRVSTPSESIRTSPFDVAQANFKRVQEALRSLEEFGKCLSHDLGRRCETVRYRLYTLEKAVLGTPANRERLAHCRLYWLLTREQIIGAEVGRRRSEVGRRTSRADEPSTQYSVLRTPYSDRDIERQSEGDRQSTDPSPLTPHHSLTTHHSPLTQPVQDALGAGVDVVQIREKTMTDAELLDWARTVRRWTRETGTLLIINDRPDIAVLCEADGVHVGQTELSVADVRRIAGPRMLVGVSTRNIEQARKAVLDGADYLGVGPVFPSSTKSFESLAGLDYVREVAAEISLPWFAIGGIDETNVTDAVAAGATRIAVSGALSLAESPTAAARRLRERLGKQDSA